MADSNPIFPLIRQWFDFAFANPAVVRPVHAAIYMWHVELNNRRGWVAQFASPATQTMAACGVNSYNTYKAAFNDLVEWGFIKIIKKSENQYQSNIVALSISDKPTDKSLDYALSISDKPTDKSLDEPNADHVTNHLQHNNTYRLIDHDTIKPIDENKEQDSFPDIPPQAPVAAEKEKKISAPKKEKSRSVVFRESEYFDMQKFTAAFAGTKYEFYHMEYYYEAVLNWSDSKGEKKLDWVATARGFMLRDAQGGKAVVAGKNLLSNNNSNNNGKSGFTNNNGQQSGRYDDYKAQLAAEMGIDTSNNHNNGI